jgi:hypothetical protein
MLPGLGRGTMDLLVFCLFFHPLSHSGSQFYVGLKNFREFVQKWSS